MNYLCFNLVLFYQTKKILFDKTIIQIVITIEIVIRDKFIFRLNFQLYKITSFMTLFNSSLVAGFVRKPEKPYALKLATTGSSK